jgi:hypothetical protein
MILPPTAGSNDCLSEVPASLIEASHKGPYGTVVHFS